MSRPFPSCGAPGPPLTVLCLRGGAAEAGCGGREIGHKQVPLSMGQRGKRLRLLGLPCLPKAEHFLRLQPHADMVVAAVLEDELQALGLAVGQLPVSQDFPLPKQGYASSC